MALLTKPQIQPTVGSAPTVKDWKNIQAGFTGIYTLLQGLVLYLQTYLTKIYNAVVPSQLNVVTVASAQSPYTIALTDEFIAAAAGTYNLPPATGSGRTMVIFNTGSGIVEIVPLGTDKLNGGGAISPSTQYQTTSLIDATAGMWFYWTIV